MAGLLRPGSAGCTQGKRIKPNKEVRPLKSARNHGAIAAVLTVVFTLIALASEPLARLLDTLMV